MVWWSRIWSCLSFLQGEEILIRISTTPLCFLDCIHPRIMFVRWEKTKEWAAVSGLGWAGWQTTPAPIMIIFRRLLKWLCHCKTLLSPHDLARIKAASKCGEKNIILSYKAIFSFIRIIRHGNLQEEICCAMQLPASSALCGGAWSK